MTTLLSCFSETVKQPPFQKSPIVFLYGLEHETLTLELCTEEKYMTIEVKANEKEESPDLQGVAEMYR